MLLWDLDLITRKNGCIQKVKQFRKAQQKLPDAICHVFVARHSF